MPAPLSPARRVAGIVRRDGVSGLADRVRLRRAFRSPGPWNLRLQGGRFHFAHRGELYAYVETFVHHVYDQLPGFTPISGQTVVDVGANVGCFVAYAMRRMGRGRLYAIEPNPEVYGRLSALAAEGQARRPGLRLVLRQAAVGARPVQVRLIVPRGASVRGAVDSLGTAPAAADAAAFEVPAVTLDGWLGAEGAGRIDLLKIDVEGAEEDVLAGAAATLAATRRLVMEWHGPGRLAAVRARVEAAGLLLLRSVPDPDDPQVGIAYFARDARASVERGA